MLGSEYSSLLEDIDAESPETAARARPLQLRSEDWDRRPLTTARVLNELELEALMGRMLESSDESSLELGCLPRGYGLGGRPRHCRCGWGLELA